MYIAEIFSRIAQNSQFGDGKLKKRGIKFDRLLAILHLFDAGGTYTAGRLAKKFDVDEKTILRDMDDLRRLEPARPSH